MSLLEEMKKHALRLKKLPQNKAESLGSIWKFCKENVNKSDKLFLRALTFLKDAGTQFSRGSARF